MKDVTALNDIWDWRKEHIGQALIFKDDEGLISTNTDLNSDGSLPNEIYI